MGVLYAGFEAHPMADAFPLITGDEFAALVESVGENGLREPGIVWEGQLLDGRNRARACEVAGVPFRTEEVAFPSPRDAAAYVADKNLTRRHLTASQRAIAAAKLVTTSGRGRPRESDVTLRDAAKLAGVSERSVRTARRVVEDGADELIEAVRDGNVSVHEAAAVAQTDHEAQRAELERRKVAAERADGARRVQHSSASVEHYTPAWIVELARIVLDGIDTDPATCEEANREVVQASTWFTAADDGLAQRWHGGVWLNPPYGRMDVGGRERSSQGVWTRSALERLQDGEIDAVCMLVRASTGAEWWRPLWGCGICFISGRVKHWTPGGEVGTSPAHYSAVVYAGPRMDLFAECFAPHGVVYLPSQAPVWQKIASQGTN